MQGRPSTTAKRVALLRAAHQLLESGAIFDDPLAVAISGDNAETIAAEAHGRPQLRPLRLFVAARSRFAEEAASHAVDRGVRQVVVLGAGLDTFGLRNPHSEKGVCVYEVDTPATQQWKFDCLASANLQIPESLRFVPVNFEHQTFLEVLPAAGFRQDKPAFFMWLGVVPYLSREAVFATLKDIAGLPGSEVVFDYGQPPDVLPTDRRAGYEAMIAHAAALGEPRLSLFREDDLRRDMQALGFAEIEDCSLGEVLGRYSEGFA